MDFLISFSQTRIVVEELRSLTPLLNTWLAQAWTFQEAYLESLFWLCVVHIQHSGER